VTRPLLSILAALLVAACATYYVPAGYGKSEGLAVVGAGYGEAALARITADMDPATLALARRHDPGRHTDYWGRVRGWERIDIKVLPSLGFGTLSFEDARTVNSFLLAVDTPVSARPFLLQASANDTVRAINCMSQAVYYEAGFEPAQGRRAVAQVVINRMRHAGYPKSICGVIYQGAGRTTGCQFSFTCDGSLSRPVNAAAWSDAQYVARQALSGTVEPGVGVSTHYHADYVSPYWAPTLVKLAQIGQHIFYRWTGPQGELAAFNGRYAGGEANLTAAILQSDDVRAPNLPPGTAVAAAPAPRVVQFTQEGQVRSYVISDTPMALGGGSAVGTAGLGILTPTRRKPTREEIAKINAALAGLPEAKVDTIRAQAAAAPTIAPAPKAAAPAVPILRQ
jgi:spore germination cell wall hydrolase CwlJ-like protein